MLILKNLKNKKFLSIINLIFVFGLVGLVWAQPVTPPVVPPPVGGQGPIRTVDEVIGLLRQILVWVAIIFWIFAVLMIFWAAFKFLTSGGDQEKVGKAKQMLLYAIVAIALGLMAYAIPTFVESFLKGRA